MKNRLIVALMIVAMLGTAMTAAVAAPGPRDGSGKNAAWSEKKAERHEQRMARMAEVLDLTEEQRTQIASIISTQREKCAPLRERMKETRQQLREAARADQVDENAVRSLTAAQSEAKAELMIHKAQTRSRIQALLTDEQRQKAERLHAVKKDGKGGHSHRGKCW